MFATEEEVEHNWIFSADQFEDGGINLTCSVLVASINFIIFSPFFSFFFFVISSCG